MQDGELVGFVHTVLDDDPQWGALLDNLHVRADWQRHRLGSRLVAASARAVVDERPGRALYLWVLERNARARAFDAARGGAEVERAEEAAPDGTPIVMPPRRLARPRDGNSRLKRGPRSGHKSASTVRAVRLTRRRQAAERHRIAASGAASNRRRQPAPQQAARKETCDL